jgi:hypothetical protein
MPARRLERPAHCQRRSTMVEGRGRGTAAPFGEAGMPTLWRLIRLVALVAALAFAGMYALATFVTPEARDITVTVPTDLYVR